MAHLFVTPEDVKIWVEAAACAAFPVLKAELTGPLRSAATLHEDLLLKTVREMLLGMQHNTDRMGRVIANQGRLFIGMGMAGFIMSDRELTRREKALYLLTGLGFLGLVDKAVNR